MHEVTPRSRPSCAQRLLAAGLTLSLSFTLAACGPTAESGAISNSDSASESGPRSEPGAGPKTSVSRAEIWAQSPGVNQMTQNLQWEAISTEARGDLALAAATVPSPFPTNLVHAVYRDSNYCLKKATMDDQSATWAVELTGACGDFGDSGPAAVAWDFTRLDVFWFNRSLLTGATTLMHRWKDGSTWHQESLGTTLVPASSNPTVASWAVGHLDVFWTDTSNRLKRRAFDRAMKGKAPYNANGWSPEWTVATNVTGEPTATERATNAIDVYWRRASDGMLQHLWTQNGGTSWSSAESLGVVSATAPSATSWSGSRIDLVYGVSSSKLGHMWFESTSGSWKTHSESLNTTTAIGTPVAASARGRLGRIDVISLASTVLRHTFFQESLPGGVPPEPQPNGYWCWAAAGATVLNYLHPTLHLSQCQAVNAVLGRSDCCHATTPSACLVGGTAESVFDEYDQSYDSSDSPLSLASLKMLLQVAKKPVVSFHYHPQDGGGHIVVLTDVYRFMGEDYMVITDSKMGGGNWIMPYSEYLADHGSWKVTRMVWPN